MVHLAPTYSYLRCTIARGLRRPIIWRRPVHTSLPTILNMRCRRHDADENALVCVDLADYRHFFYLALCPFWQVLTIDADGKKNHKLRYQLL